MSTQIMNYKGKRFRVELDDDQGRLVRSVGPHLTLDDLRHGRTVTPEEIEAATELAIDWYEFP